MRIFVKVRPGAKEEKVDKIDEDHYLVWVKNSPQKGQANKGVIQILAGYFDKPKPLITIKSGHTSSTKVVEIL